MGVHRLERQLVAPCVVVVVGVTLAFLEASISISSRFTTYHLGMA